MGLVDRRPRSAAEEKRSLDEQLLHLTGDADAYVAAAEQG